MFKVGFACVLLGLAPLAQADIWKYVDENGVSHFTNQAPQRGDAQIVIRSFPEGDVQTSVADRTPEAAVKHMVAAMNASPTYHAVSGHLADASRNYGVDLDLLKAVTVAESGFKADAVSHKGAVGLMQVMPDTAKLYGVRSEPGLSVRGKLTNPQINIQTGTQHLSRLLGVYGGRVDLALAAYNAGEGAVERAGNRIPNFAETRRYVRNVLSVYNFLQRQAP